MARSLDTIVRDTLGNDRLTEIQLTAQIEALTERVKELEQKYEPTPAVVTVPAPPE